MPDWCGRLSVKNAPVFNYSSMEDGILEAGLPGIPHKARSEVHCLMRTEMLRHLSPPMLEEEVDRCFTTWASFKNSGVSSAFNGVNRDYTIDFIEGVVYKVYNQLEALYNRAPFLSKTYFQDKIFQIVLPGISHEMETRKEINSRLEEAGIEVEELSFNQEIRYRGLLLTIKDQRLNRKNPAFVRNIINTLRGLYHKE